MTSYLYRDAVTYGRTHAQTINRTIKRTTKRTYVHTYGRTYGPTYVRTGVRTPQKLTNHFSHPPQKRPEILTDPITRPQNPGTFARIRQKAVGHFLAVPTVAGKIFWAFF